MEELQYSEPGTVKSKGQSCPSPYEWKNGQKNDRKNRISDTINRIIPHRRPFVTIFVRSP